MSDEEIAVDAVSAPVEVHPMAPLPASTDEPAVPAAGTSEPVTGTTEPSNPAADAVNEYLARRIGEGSPTIEEAFQKYRDRRQANADSVAAYLNGTGPNPFEGHRL